MASSVLLTRPDHDITTRYVSRWSEKIIDEARNKGCDVVDLSGNKANRKRFIGTLKKKSPKLVVLNGHGDHDVVTGYDNEPILNVSDEDVAGKIIYARSCESAKTLGKECVKLGASAYLGYDEDFIFWWDDEKVLHPLEDETAALFLNPLNLVPLALLKGHTAEQANKKSKNLFAKNIERLVVAGSSDPDYHLIRYLYWDMKHQVCLGDSNATF